MQARKGRCYPALPVLMHAYLHAGEPDRFVLPAVTPAQARMTAERIA
jgi:hypothetical protein